MKNPYKRTDVFKCSYDGHAKFDNRVSAFHVLRQKKCYPQGCLMFHWSCELKNKGKSCYRGYNYVGRLCEGCPHYDDNKVHHQPRLLLDHAQYEAFQQQVEAFEEWLAEHRDRDLDVLCEVSSVKPCFRKTITDGRGQLRLDGYLLVIRRGFIGLTEFDDYFYARISPHQQDRLRIAPDDRFEARARLALDRGRVLLTRLWSVQVEERSGAETWNNSRALVAKISAVEFAQQPENCFRCPQGALVDVVEICDGEKRNKRALYCLAGVSAPELCSLQVFEKMDMCIG